MLIEKKKILIKILWQKNSFSFQYTSKNNNIIFTNSESRAAREAIYKDIKKPNDNFDMFTLFFSEFSVNGEEITLSDSGGLSILHLS